MTLKEAAQKAVRDQDYKMFGQVVEQLRSMGFNYDDSASFFKKNCSIDKEEYEKFCFGSDLATLFERYTAEGQEK